MGKYLGILTLILLLGSCTIIDTDPVIKENISVELDGRLPMDVNGYYHLKLNLVILNNQVTYLILNMY